MHSLVERIGALLPVATARPWRQAPSLPAGERAIAHVVTQPDADLAVAMVNSASTWIELHGVAKAIHGRSILGLTYLRKAERVALQAALNRLEGQ
jgi:FAD/FMN-containing dehydrogenase